jgi:DNA modification methylase
MTWEILVGDVRKVARTLEAESFDAILSDPPYGISFMGSRWDYDIPSVNVFTELLRVLRPGAHAFFFGGTRTFHRMAVNIEDAGFELRDTCMWMYGSGFPKSTDVSKALDKKLGAKRTKVVGYKNSGLDKGSGSSVDFAGSTGRAANGLIPVTEPVTAAAAAAAGHGTALKPAWEPLLLVRKQFDGTVPENLLAHGVGSLDIDASRIGSDERFVAPAGNNGMTPASVAPVNTTGYNGQMVVGRWPANVVLSHSPDCKRVGEKTRKRRVERKSYSQTESDGCERSAPGRFARAITEEVVHVDESSEVWECVEDCPMRRLDEQAGDRPGMSGGGVHRLDYAGGMFGGIDSTSTARGDTGGPSRFFYSAKVSRDERDRGLDDAFEEVTKGVGALRDSGRGGKARNSHPTLKPFDLCRYFARMILPPVRADGRPRRILVPFSGAGSEMIGSLQAGWDEVVGIELSPKFAAFARARIAKGKIIQAVR